MTDNIGAIRRNESSVLKYLIRLKNDVRRNIKQNKSTEK